MVAIVEDFSSNGTFINGMKVSHIFLYLLITVFQIGKGLFKELKNGDEIHLLREGEGVL